MNSREFYEKVYKNIDNKEIKGGTIFKVNDSKGTILRVKVEGQQVDYMGATNIPTDLYIGDYTFVEEKNNE